MAGMWTSQAKLERENTDSMLYIEDLPDSLAPVHISGTLGEWTSLSTTWPVSIWSLNCKCLDTVHHKIPLVPIGTCLATCWSTKPPSASDECWEDRREKWINHPCFQLAMCMANIDYSSHSPQRSSEKAGPKKKSKPTARYECKPLAAPFTRGHAKILSSAWVV